MRVTVGMGSCGIAAGAQKTWNVLEHCFKEQGISLSVEQVGCIGMCFNEPIVEVITDTDHFYYGKVNGEMAAEIVEKHIKGGVPVEEYLIPEEEMEFLTKQTRVALRNCGIIDPEKIEEYIGRGGYQ